MSRDTRFALFLLRDLVAVPLANVSDAFMDLLSEDMHELGFVGAGELLLGTADE